MTRREEIVVELGGDSKKLMKELNMTKQRFGTWTKEIAREITSGSIPEAWKSYTVNVQAALKSNETAVEKTTTSWKKAGSDLMKIGRAVAAAFTFGEAIQALRQVSEELGNLNKEFDSKPYLKKQREEQLNQLTPFDRENVMVGNAQWEKLKGGTSNFMATAAGLYSFGFDTLFEHAKGLWSGDHDKLYWMIHGWGEAAAKAADKQRDIMQAIRVTAREAEVQEAADKEVAAKKAARDAHEKKVLDAFNKYTEWAHEQNRKRIEKENELLADQLNLKKRIARTVGGGGGGPSAPANGGDLGAAPGTTGSDIPARSPLEDYYGYNPTSTEDWIERGRKTTEAIRAYGAQKPKSIRDRILEDRQRIANARKPDPLAKLESIIHDDAMTVRVKLAK